MMKKDLTDRKHIWHPFTKKNCEDPIVIVSGKDEKFLLLMEINILILYHHGGLTRMGMHGLSL